MYFCQAEAKGDMARLAEVKRRRAEAAKRREEEAAGGLGLTLFFSGELIHVIFDLGCTLSFVVFCS